MNTPSFTAEASLYKETIPERGQTEHLLKKGSISMRFTQTEQ